MNNLATAPIRKIKVKKSYFPKQKENIQTKIIRISQSAATAADVEQITQMLTQTHIQPPFPFQSIHFDQPYYALLPVCIDWQRAYQNFQRNQQQMDPSRLYTLITRFFLTNDYTPKLEIYPYHPTINLPDQIFEKFYIEEDEILTINEVQVYPNLLVVMIYLREFKSFTRMNYGMEITHHWRNYTDVYNHIIESTQMMSFDYCSLYTKPEGVSYQLEENPYLAIINQGMCQERQIPLQKRPGHFIPVSLLYQNIANNFAALVEKLKK